MPVACKARWDICAFRLRATIVREALEDDEWRAAHLPGLFTSADIATKAVGPQRLADLMRVMDLYTPHMEECNDPPCPSVATLKAPSIATTALMALLLFSRLTAVKAGSIPVQGETSGSIPLGSWSCGVLLLCLVTVIGLQLVQVGKIRKQACVSQVVKTAQSDRAVAMLASTFCLWAICIEKTESQDNWYLVGCSVVLICA